MDIYVPGGKAHIHPTIVLIHGGGWKGGDKNDMSQIARLLRTATYTVANINYRLDGPNNPSYVNSNADALAATQFIQANAAIYSADPVNISAFGTSSGASMALTLGNIGAVKAVVDFYGPVDFTDPAFLSDNLNGVSNTTIMGLYFGFTYASNPTAYQVASPIYNLSALSVPTIIFHGTADMTVPPAQSQELSDDLTALGIPNQLYFETGMAHGYLTNISYNPAPDINTCCAFLKIYTP